MRLNLFIIWQKHRNINFLLLLAAFLGKPGLRTVIKTLVKLVTCDNYLTGLLPASPVRKGGVEGSYIRNVFLPYREAPCGSTVRLHTEIPGSIQQI